MIITFAPPQEITSRLGVPGGLPTEDMHITLFHFDTFGPEWILGPSIIEAVTRYAQTASPFGASISSLGRFENVRKMQDENGDIVDATVPTDVILGKVDSLHLNGERDKLKDILDELDLPYSKTFAEFVPHLSIKYVPHGTSLGEDLDLPLHFTVDNIQVWPKEGEHLVFHFQK